MGPEWLKKLRSFVFRPVILTTIILFFLLALSAGILWWVEISYIHPGPSIAVGILAGVILIVGLVTDDLFQAINAPQVPDIIGLEVLVNHWQQFKEELDELDSERIYKQLLSAQQVFAGDSKLTFRKCFAGSKPEKIVMLVTPSNGEPKVLKFDRANNIRKELNRYDSCVEGRLGSHTPGRLINRWLPQDSNDGYGAVVYELAQIKRNSDLRTFGQYYNEEDVNTDSVIDVLDKIIGKMGPWWNSVPEPHDQCFYKSDTHGKRSSLYYEYDRLQRQLSKMEEGFKKDIKRKFAPILFVKDSSFDLQGEDGKSYTLCEPLNWVKNVFGEHKSTFFKEKFHDLDNRIRQNSSIVHGDFHAGNILVEGGIKNEATIWIIDFPHTHIGPTVQDIARLEADIKFGLVPSESLKEIGISGLYGFETVLNPKSDDPSAPIPDRACPPGSEHFQKAWDIVDRLRRETPRHVGGDSRFYYMALLHATLPTLYYRDRSPWQKLYAYISAALLCERLGGEG
jgi:hypothetical protein